MKTNGEKWAKNTYIYIFYDNMCTANPSTEFFFKYSQARGKICASRHSLVNGRLKIRHGIVTREKKRESDGNNYDVLHDGEFFLLLLGRENFRSCHARSDKVSRP